jgi:flagellar hook-basal body complex protein FliE
MTAEVLAAIQSVAAVGTPLAATPMPGLPTMGTSVSAAGAPGPGFGEMVSQGIDTVNQQLLVSQTDLQQLATGDAQNLHQIMIRLEESRLSFQLMLQVRNRVLEAYQDIMKTQV